MPPTSATSPRPVSRKLRMKVMRGVLVGVERAFFVPAGAQAVRARAAPKTRAQAGEPEPTEHFLRAVAASARHVASEGHAGGPISAGTACALSPSIVSSPSRYAPIVKPRAALAPNLRDYAAGRGEFTWASARAQLDGLPGGALNIAHEAVDRHVAKGRGDKRRASLAREERGTCATSPIARSWRRRAASRTCFAALGVGKGRSRLRAPPARAGALRGVPGHAQERKRVLAALLGVRARAHRGARIGLGRRQGARHDRGALREEGRPDPRRAPARSSTCSSSRLPPPTPARHARSSAP